MGNSTIPGPTITQARLILPMGEISYFNGTGTVVSIAAQSDGSTNMVAAAPASSLTSGGYEFDNGGSDNGRLRYTGATTRMFHIACSCSFGGGNADKFVLGIAKSGTVIAPSKILRVMGAAGDIGSTALHVMTEMTTNQYLELYFGNMTDTDDPTVYAMNLFAFGT